jgi:hypothetical protein
MDSEGTSGPERFFVLKKLSEGTHDTEFVRISSNLGPAPRCPQCDGVIGSLSWQPPYQGELELYGKGFGDLLKGPCDGLVMTEHFAEAFKAEGLTGLSGFHPVEVLRVRRKRRGPKPGAPPSYLFVTLAYGHPAVDVERSRIQSKKPVECTWCRYVGPDAIDGFRLEEGTWDGEDLFQARGLWGVIIVSERFMRFAERHAMSHWTFVPIEKYVWDPLGLIYPREVQLQPTSKS